MIIPEWLLDLLFHSRFCNCFFENDYMCIIHELFS